MEIQSLQPPPFSQKSKKLFSIYYGMAVVALLTSLGICYGVNGDFIDEHTSIKIFINTLSVPFSAIENISAVTPHPNISRLVLASQWIFFPFYLILLMAAHPPWGDISRKRIIININKKRKDGKIGQLWVLFLLSLFFIILIFLADFKVINFASFVTGSIFSIDAWVLSFQRKSMLGVVLVSWLSPLSEATLWHLFFLGLRATSLLIKQSETH